MMRILHIDHSPVLGGAERSLIELAHSQMVLGHDVVVGVGRSGPFRHELRAVGIRTVDLRWPHRYIEATSRIGWLEAGLGLPRAVVAAARLRQVIGRLQPEILHAHTRKAQLVSSLAVTTSRVPLVWHLRDYPPPRGPIRAAMGVAIGRAAHAVALTHWLAAQYVEAGLIPRSGRIDRVPSSVDPSAFDGLPTPWLDGGRAPIVGYVGNVARAKGPHLLVDAAERLTDRPDVTFAIVGDVWFPRSDDGYGQWLRDRIERSPVGDRIVWLGTRTPREAFASIDVLVHPSVEPEPFGRVLVEAMIARRPIVAFGHGGPAEILDESTAELARPGDADALAAAIRRTVDDPTASAARTVRAAAQAIRYAPMEVAKAMDLAYSVVRR